MSNDLKVDGHDTLGVGGTGSQGGLAREPSKMGTEGVGGSDHGEV